MQDGLCNRVWDMMWTVCCKMVFNSHSHYVNSSGTESESGVDGFAGVRSILLSHEVHEGFILVCIMRLSQYRCITSIVNSCNIILFAVQWDVCLCFAFLFSGDWSDKPFFLEK